VLFPGLLLPDLERRVPVRAVDGCQGEIGHDPNLPICPNLPIGPNFPIGTAPQNGTRPAVHTVGVSPVRTRRS
jgi:hypothetical protein